MTVQFQNFDNMKPNLKENTEANKRFDYVIVVDRKIKQLPFYEDVLKFLHYLQGRGIIVELGYGNVCYNIPIQK